jgi:hypothetical protein
MKMILIKKIFESIMLFALCLIALIGGCNDKKMKVDQKFYKTIHHTKLIAK